MTVGWNRRYVLHCVSCNQWISKSSKLLILSILVTVLVTIQTPSAFVFSDQDLHLASQNPVVRASVVSLENSGPHQSKIQYRFPPRGQYHDCREPGESIRDF